MCVRARPSRAKCQFIDLGLKDSLVNSSDAVGEIKVSVIPQGNLARLEPVSLLIPEIILRLKIYINTIKIRSELQATFKKETNI